MPARAGLCRAYRLGRGNVVLVHKISVCTGHLPYLQEKKKNWRNEHLLSDSDQKMVIKLKGRRDSGL